MRLSKQQRERLIGIGLSLIVSVLAVFGYHVVVAEPVVQDALVVVGIQALSALGVWLLAT